MELFDTNSNRVVRVSGKLCLGLPKAEANSDFAALIIDVKGGQFDGKAITTGISVDVARALRTALKVFIDSVEAKKND